MRWKEPSVKRQRGLLGLALLACQQGMIQVGGSSGSRFGGALGFLSLDVVGALVFWAISGRAWGGVLS